MMVARMLYVSIVFLIALPINVILSIIMTIWGSIDLKLNTGHFETKYIFNAYWEGAINGFKYVWHWAKTGEKDFIL